MLHKNIHFSQRLAMIWNSTQKPVKHVPIYNAKNLAAHTFKLIEGTQTKDYITLAETR